MLPYLIAASPSLLFGTFSLILGRWQGDDRQKVFGIFAGAFLTALVATPFLGAKWSPQIVIISFISGVSAFIGIRDQTRCLRVLGVSRTMPISTGLQLVAASLAGVVLMGEWRGAGAMPVGLVAIAMLVAGVWLTSRREKGAEGDQLDWRLGARLLATSTVGLVGFLVIVQYFGISGRDAMLPQAVGYGLAALVLTSPRIMRDGDGRDTRWSRATIPFMVAGVLWAIAILVLMITSSMVGVATGFTLAQLGVILSTLGGIWWLGEHRTHRELIWTLAGLALVVAGAFVVGYAKSLDV